MELDLDDIQGIVLQERTFPYVGTYLLLKIDNKENGQNMLKNLIPVITSAGHWGEPSEGEWINVAFTYAGLEKLGISEDSLDSFSTEFKAGMASRADKLRDLGESAPENWEAPFGTGDLHFAIALFATNQEKLDGALEKAKHVYRKIDGITLLFELDIGSPIDGRTHMGFTDGISNPSIEGNRLNPPIQGETPLKAGEFIFGKKNELGHIAEGPKPESLGNNGSYLALRKLHMRVAAFRGYLHNQEETPEKRELLAAKMVGRWPSGAPLSLAPDKDNPELAKDVDVRNDFLYEDDPKGLKCPISSHVRRANPRDSLNSSITDVNIHRLLRRSTVYGPPLPKDELEDDGIDRGIIFAGICTSLSRQYEFIKSTWLSDGNFVDLSKEEDPITGNHNEKGTFTIPDEPFRQRLHGIPSFSLTKGGEYFFIPSITGLHWLAGMD